MLAELWKPIPDYPNYWISTWGRVRNHRYNRMLKPSRPTNGYLQVNLSNNSHSKSKCIHQLMARTFMGEQPNSFEINHIDGNQANNHLYNLEYIYWRLNRRKAKTVIFCIACGKRIYGSSKTCSPKCHLSVYHTLLRCATCNKEFYRVNSVIDQRENDPRYNKKYYCSTKCYANRPDHHWKKDILRFKGELERLV